MSTAILNINLFVAEKLLEFIERGPWPIGPVIADRKAKFLLVQPKNIPELSESELISALSILADRKAIIFSNIKEWVSTYGEDNFVPTGQTLDIEPSKRGLREFVRIANDATLKIDLKTRAERINNLAIFHTLTMSKENPIKLDKFVIMGPLRYLGWIADYSGIIKINTSTEPDVDVDRETGEAHVIGLYQDPKSIGITDASRLNVLAKNVRARITNQFYDTRSRALLTSNADVVWRCVKCGRWLENLNTYAQVSNLLVDFYINNFRVCYKCRTRNLFSVSCDGRMRALSSKDNFSTLARLPGSISIK